MLAMDFAAELEGERWGMKMMIMCMMIFSATGDLNNFVEASRSD